MSIFTELCTAVLSPNLEQRAGCQALEPSQNAFLPAVPIAHREQEQGMQDQGWYQHLRQSDAGL